MSNDLKQAVEAAVGRCGRDRSRLLDVARDVQRSQGHISDEAMELMASGLNTSRVEVESLVSFYAFLSREPKGRQVIRLSDCVACRGRDGAKTEAALESALGIKLGDTTADGQFTLERTSCIGLCDQGPAALVNETPVARLTADKVPQMVRAAREGKLAGAGFEVVDLVRQRGEVLLSGAPAGKGLERALTLAPEVVINEIKDAKLRGRGGAGFLTGLKWQLARAAHGTPKVVICNADEGEPGTFKDRVLFTQAPELVFEGMAIAAWAIGASEGILYLRGEYEFLRPGLEALLGKLRAGGKLGKNLGGKQGFDFDVRIQMGAGAYVCGEESALINSCEGKPGVPRDRPPFPVERGYLGRPTSVNNVETFACAARVMERGEGWFRGFGVEESTGTKLLSVSGDVAKPGVYELPFGITLADFLKTVGGEGAQAVLVGGPSGSFVAPAQFSRRLGFSDLPTGGSMMVFAKDRDLLEVAQSFMEFFVEESCGWCTPCRVGNSLISQRLESIRRGEGLPGQLDELAELCTTVKKMSRCGLGQSSPNPVLSTLTHFRPLYEARLSKKASAILPSFHLEESLAEASRLQGRPPVFHEE